jgi:hypothetical protein
VRVRSRLLRRWDPDNNFARFGALEIFARDFFDKPRVSLQRSHQVAKLRILLIQARQIFCHAIDFTLRPTHSDKTMRAENVVNHKRENEQSKNRAAVPFQKCAKPGLRFWLF